ncbi:hypothetical protein ACFPER_07305 [Agromyces aurantiacus]|uniref:MmcQ/YjbR family DNA-binding protein n=1 Tax=Agromyces aurantiacus TaxID=165814 RepID=A0ABV9R378_9MICO|nr:hypothetical protein [Agromyces aurantiacus]MBM7503273.1 hypothetical protein [Agromyces aurantiacus]
MDDVQSTYDAVANELLEDADFDVDATPDGLLVKGRLFAFLDGGQLVVDLPAGRSSDLQQRGIVEPFHSTRGGDSRTWVRVADRELWSELAREAHEFVGEPPVGRES